MRHTRTALARLFVNLACIVLPDAMGREYVALLEAQRLLITARREQREGSRP